MSSVSKACEDKSRWKPATSRPLPSRFARHPPPKRGWASKIEAGDTLPKPMPPPSMGEGDHEAGIKLAAHCRRLYVARQPHLFTIYHLTIYNCFLCLRQIPPSPLRGPLPPRKRWGARGYIAARHPPPQDGCGQERHGGEEELTQTLVSPAEL